MGNKQYNNDGHIRKEVNPKNRDEWVYGI